jgi:hypothetical protein
MKASSASDLGDQMKGNFRFRLKMTFLTWLIWGSILSHEKRLRHEFLGGPQYSVDGIDVHTVFYGVVVD